MERRSNQFFTMLVFLLVFPVFIVFAQEKEWGSINWQQFKGTTISVTAPASIHTDVYVKVIPQFEALTGIKVNFEQLADVDRKKKNLIDFSTHMGEYDVTSVGIGYRDEFAQPGFLEPLEKYYNNPKLTDKAWYDLNDYPKYMYQTGFSGGVWYTLPYTAEYLLTIYRKDIFRDLGLAAPKTRTEIRSVATKLDEARKAGKIKAYGWVDRQKAAYIESGWNIFATVSRSGRNIIDYNKRISYVRDPKVLEVLTWYCNMIRDFAPPGSGNWSWSESYDAFRTGQLAMMGSCGNSQAPYLEDPKESQVVGKVGYSPTPVEAGGKEPIWNWQWAINADSKHKEASWLFVQWATSKQIQAKIALISWCPPRKSNYRDPDFKKAMPSQEFIDVNLFMIENVDPSPMQFHPDWSESADIIAKELSNVHAGIKTVDEATKDIQKGLIKLGFTPSASSQ